MTSQSILWNLLNENLKRRILTVVLSVYFVVMSAFSAITSIQNAGSGDPKELFFGSAGNGFIWVSILIAAVCAVNGFSFLFSRVKTDFYYSLPVTKKDVYLSVYLNGIGIYFIPNLIYHVILAGYGYASGYVRYSGTFQYMAVSILLTMAAYLLVYHAILVVVMICGNLWTASAVSVFVLAFGKLAALLTKKYGGLFFATYYNSQTSDMVFKFLSPAELIRSMMWVDGGGEAADWTIRAVMPEAAAVLAGILTAGIAAYLLYRKRPAENAGQAVVFQKGQMLLSALLVILASLGGGLGLMSLSSDGKSAVMMTAGLLIAAVAVHGILQMIYQSEIRAFTGKKVQLLVTCAAAVVIAAVFRADLLRFDQFIPRADKVESMAVSIKGLSDLYAVTDGKRSEKEDMMADMRFRNMKLTGEAKKTACEWIKKLEKEKPEGENAYSYASVFCRMKNGREVYRRYYIPSESVLLKFADVFESEEYQDGEWPVLRDGFAMEKDISWSNGAETFTINLTDAEKKEFLDIYKSELRGIRMEELTTELPSGTIMLSYGGSAGEYSFLYPSFEKTTAYLEAKGIPADKTLADYESVEIAVRQRAEDGSYVGRETIYDNPQETEEIMKNLVFEDYHINPLLYPLNTTTVIDVKLKSSAGSTITEVRCLEK